MIWESLDTKLIVPDLEAEDKNDVFRKVGGMLVEQGFCKPSYVDALIEREKDYPTGINMGDFGIAMPHTERTHVNKAAVAIARLKKPVLFYEMGSEDEEVQASLVFMLAVEDPKAHLPFLQRLMSVFQDQVVLDKIMHTDSKEDIVQIIKDKESTM